MNLDESTTCIGHATESAIEPGQLPGVQWQPSNGTEGGCFIDAWCSNCARDKVMNGEATVEEADTNPDLYCRILNDSFSGDGAQEWRTIDGEVRCIAFIKQGERVADRCPHTIELPL